MNMTCLKLHKYIYFKAQGENSVVMDSEESRNSIGRNVCSVLRHAERSDSEWDSSVDWLQNPDFKEWPAA